MDVKRTSASPRGSVSISPKHDAQKDFPPLSVTNFSAATRTVSTSDQISLSNDNADVEEFFAIAISDQLRANYFGKDVSTQVDKSYMLDLKRTEQKVTTLGKELKAWKHDLILTREGLIACYEKEVEVKALELGKAFLFLNSHSASKETASCFFFGEEQLSW